MSDLIIFENEDFGQIRTITRNNEIWFIANDVAASLGYKDTKKAVKSVCKSIEQIPHNNGVVSIINESDMYRLILKSTLPAAEQFQTWVVEEVLPSLRSTGTYSITQVNEERIPHNYQPKQLSIKDINAELAAALDISKKLRVGEDNEVVSAVSIIEKTHGINLLDLAGISKEVIRVLNPEITNEKVISQNEFVRATTLGEELGLSPSQVNMLMQRVGLVKKHGRTWYPTKNGKKYLGTGILVSKRGESYRVKNLWNIDVVELLKKYRKDILELKGALPLCSSVGKRHNFVDDDFIF